MNLEIWYSSSALSYANTFVNSSNMYVHKQNNNSGIFESIDSLKMRLDKNEENLMSSFLLSKTDPR